MDRYRIYRSGVGDKQQSTPYSECICARLVSILSSSLCFCRRFMAVGLPKSIATTHRCTKSHYAQEYAPVPKKLVQDYCITIEVALAKRPLRTLLWASVCRLGFCNLHLLSATALLDEYLLFHQACCDRSAGRPPLLTEDAISWIILACVQLACKFHEDNHWSNLRACQLWDMHSSNDLFTLTRFESHIFSKLFCSRTSARTPNFYFLSSNLRQYEIILRICTLDASRPIKSPNGFTICPKKHNKSSRQDEVDHYLSTCSLDKYLSDLSENKCGETQNDITCIS